MRLEEVLKSNNLTKRKLAQKLGWSPQRLYSRLKKPSMETLKIISKAIPCEPHELIKTSEGYAHFYADGRWQGIRATK